MSTDLRAYALQELGYTLAVTAHDWGAALAHLQAAMAVAPSCRRIRFRLTIAAARARDADPRLDWIDGCPESPCPQEWATLPEDAALPHLWLIIGQEWPGMEGRWEQAEAVGAMAARRGGS